MTSTFDIYFHLWNNGTPHWEKGKRAWKIELENEWTRVMSKNEKRALKKQENAHKRVKFAEIAQSSPKATPIVSSFGSFTTTIDPGNLDKTCTPQAFSSHSRSSADKNHSGRIHVSQGPPDHDHDRIHDDQDQLVLRKTKQCDRRSRWDLIF